jgi:hypothetical protein
MTCSRGLTSDSFCTVILNSTPAITSALVYGEVAALAATQGPALCARGGRVCNKPETATRSSTELCKISPRFIIRPNCTLSPCAPAFGCAPPHTQPQLPRPHFPLRERRPRRAHGTHGLDSAHAHGGVAGTAQAHCLSHRPPVPAPRSPNPPRRPCAASTTQRRAHRSRA